MKPEMARLTYEIVEKIASAEEQMLALDELNALFRADSAVKKERMRNAVSRLCASRNLRKVSTGYAFLKLIEPEPPEVPTLFPEASTVVRAPEKPTSTIRASKGQAASVDDLRAQLSASEGTSVVSRAQWGSLRQWLLTTIRDGGDGEFKASDLAAHAVRIGITESEGSVRQSISKLARDGEVLRVKRGVYRAIVETVHRPVESEAHEEAGPPVATGTRPAPPTPLRSRTLPEKAVCALADDLDVLEKLVESWKEELAATERRASALRMRIAENEERLKWRRETHRWVSDTVDFEEETEPSAVMESA